MKLYQKFPNEDVQYLLKRFKKHCEQEGVIRELKKHSCYEKPSDEKRRKLFRSIKRRKQEELLKKSS